MKSFGWFSEPDAETGGTRWTPKLVPLKDGAVQWKRAIEYLRQVGWDADGRALVSLHSEYQGRGSWRSLETPELLAQTGEDFAFLKRPVALAGERAGATLTGCERRGQRGQRRRPDQRGEWGRGTAAAGWMLGEAPPGALGADEGQVSRYGAEAPHVAALLGRAAPGEGLEKHGLVFGEYVAGDVFAPVGTAAAAVGGEGGRAGEGGRGVGRRVPGVLWLHPFSVPRGYVAGYMRGEQPVRTLARAGFAVLGFDQIGHGRRIEEAEHFYRRHPRWSLLGKMVRDSAAALGALAALPFVDPAQVWVVGYGLGALVGLHLCALDARPAGLAAVCLPPPYRTDTDVAETGGFGRWARRYLLLPRLGWFDGLAEGEGRGEWGNQGSRGEGESQKDRESRAALAARIPYDLDELLAAVAPRPALVVSPTLDREAPLARVTEGVERARRLCAARGVAARLEQVAPVDYNRFVTQGQEVVAQWLRGRVGEGR